MATTSLFQAVIDSLVGSTGFGIFVPLILIFLFLMFAFSKGLPLTAIFTITFMAVFMFGAYTVGGVPLFEDLFQIMFIIIFGLVLGIMFYIFWVRR